MYLDHKLDSRKIIFFTSYRNIASTNTLVNVDDWYFLSSVAPRRNLPLATLESPSRSQPLNFPVRFTVQHVPETVADRWRVLWWKYLPQLFQCFPVVTRMCARDIGAWCERVHTNEYTRRCVHIYLIPRWTASLSLAGFISIAFSLFQTNKRECSHLLLPSLPFGHSPMLC